MITNLGELSLSSLNPASVSAVAAADAAIGVSLGNLQAQLDGALFAQAGLIANPPTLAGQVTALAEMAAALALAISLGVPDVSFQLTAIGDVVASLQTSIGALNAQLAALVEVNTSLAVGGVAAYVYEGETSKFGQELHSALGGGFAGGSPGTQARALVLATTASEAWDAVKYLYGV